MPYQLGTYVRAHNRRQGAARAARYLLPAAAAAGKAVYNNLPSLPSFSEQRIVAQAVRAAHELKRNDQGQVYTALNATFQSFLLNAVLQGSGGSNRTGRQANLEKLRFTFAVQNNTALIVDEVRLTLVYDKLSRGAAPQQADVIANNSTQTYALISDFDMDNVPARFQILMDKRIVLLPRFSGQNVIVQETMDIPLKKRMHFYNTTIGNITDIDVGAIYLIASCISAANFPLLAFYSSIFFRDI